MTPSLPRLLADAAASRPDVVAVRVVDGAALTYRVWEQRSQAQAGGLSAAGINAGDRVALLFDAERWTDYAVAYMSVLMVGGVALPLDAQLSSLEISRALRAAAVSALVAPADLAPSGLHRRHLDPDQLERSSARGPAPGSADGIAEILVRSRHLAAPVLRPRRLEEILAAAALPVDAAGADGALLHWWPVGSRPGQDALCATVLPRAVRAVVVPAYEPVAIERALADRGVAACSLHPAVAGALLRDADGAEWVQQLRAVVLAGGRVSEGLRHRFADVSADTSVLVAEADDGGPADDAAGAPAVDAAPAAASQEGMVWHECFAPGCQNLPGLARRFRGALDIEALCLALDEIVRRHEPLRSTFCVRGGRLQQIVHAPRDAELRRSDLSALPPEQREAEVERLVAEAGSAPFDLVDGSLFEPTLVRLADDDHVLIIRTHHSVFDDWSVGVFRRQLAALYGAYAAGQQPAPWEPPITFAAFAREQRRALEGEAGAAEMRFWSDQLRGAPLTTQLPVQDHNAPAGAAQPAAGPVTMTFPADVRAALRALARRERATVFMLLLAAFGAVVSRRTGQEDLLLSTVVANRNRTELEGLIGCFTKKVPLRLDLRGDPEFTQMVARTRGALLGALQHQELPFEAVMQHVLGPSAEVHGLVPTNVVMVQGVTPRQALLMPDVESTGFETGTRAPRGHFMSAPAARRARAPWGGGIYLGTFVILSVSDEEDELSCTARGAFDNAAVEALLDDVAGVVAAAAGAPALRLSALTAAMQPSAPRADDSVDLDGFRVDARAMAAALRECRGVREAEVHFSEDGDGAARLVAEIVPDGVAPTLDALRVSLWARTPGYAWPASIRVVDGPASAVRTRQDADGMLLGAFWAEERDVEDCLPDDNYWQDFSFLEALASARDAGVRVPTPLITRNRTLRTLATALAAARGMA